MAEKRSVKPKPTSARLLPNHRPNPIEEAAKELGPEFQTTGEPKQSPLIAEVEEAKHPVPVQAGRILATYLGMKLERNKDGDRFIDLDFSFPLTSLHNGLIPRKVREAWTYLKHSGNKAVQVIHIPPDSMGVYLDPKEKEAELAIGNAHYIKATVSQVEETGKGKTVIVTRFRFRLRVERSKENVNFAAWNDGEQFWIRLDPVQKELEL